MLTTTTLAEPHGPYIAAVHHVLGSLTDHTPGESWAETASDNGEVMIHEGVISLDPERAADLGHQHGLFLFWDQLNGWTWASGREDGMNEMPEELVGPIVPEPLHVAAAAEQLLSGRSEALPAPAGPTKPRPGPLPAAVAASLRDGNITAGIAQQLGAYCASPVITALADALRGAGLADCAVAPGMYGDVAVRLSSAADAALAELLGIGGLLLAMGLCEVGVRTIGGGAMPNHSSVYLDVGNAQRLADLVVAATS